MTSTPDTAASRSVVSSSGIALPSMSPKSSMPPRSRIGSNSWSQTEYIRTECLFKVICPAIVCPTLPAPITAIVPILCSFRLRQFRGRQCGNRGSANRYTRPKRNSDGVPEDEERRPHDEHRDGDRKSERQHRAHAGTLSEVLNIAKSKNEVTVERCQAVGYRVADHERDHGRFGTHPDVHDEGNEHGSEDRPHRRTAGDEHVEHADGDDDDEQQNEVRSIELFEHLGTINTDDRPDIGPLKIRKE